MKTCCKNVPEITCQIVYINKRIAPLQFEDNTLIVSSPMKLENTLTIGGATISVGDGNTMNLPARTLINGVPLISSVFTNDVITLPNNSIYNGYAPTIEQFFYFFLEATSTLLSPSYEGYIINGRSFAESGNPTVFLRGFPFIAPEDCVLTSFRMLYVLSPGTSGTPGNASISLNVMDANMNTFFTGVSYTITSPASDSRTFLESEFEYFVRKGDSVGVFVSGTSQSGGSGGVCPYATLGYRIIPPGVLTSSHQNISKLKLLKKVSSSHYNRFPFNNLMNFRSKFPISFEEQLDIIQSNRTNSEALYGRKLTSNDYDDFSVKQDHIVYLLMKNKKNGSYLDISDNCFEDTLKLDSEYQWKGILVGATACEAERPNATYCLGDLLEMNYLQLLEQQDIPDKHMDYFSFHIKSEDENENVQIFERLIPIFDHFTFAIVKITHTEDSSVQSLSCRMLLHYQYELMFHNVVAEKDSVWSVYETWYVNPSFLSPQMLKTIREHPENITKIRWSKCLQIINSITSLFS